MSRPVDRSKSEVLPPAFTPKRGNRRSTILPPGTPNEHKLPQATPELEDSLKEIVGSTWHTYRATSLFRFRSDPASLRVYARALSAALQAAKNFVTISNSVENKDLDASNTTFTLLKGLTVNDFDHDALLVTMSVSKDSDVKTAPVCRALFCSVGNELAPKEDFVSLPLVLIKARAPIARALIDWFQVQFDCRIAPLTLRPHDLIWVATEWAVADARAEKLQRPLELTYKLSSTVIGNNDINEISLTVSPSSIAVLQSSIVEKLEPDQEMTGKELIEALEKHFYHHFHIDLSKMILRRVGTFACFIGSEGRLKLLPLEGMVESSAFVLQYLTYLASRHYF